MYKCSNCGHTMSQPFDRCPNCKVPLSGVRCESCKYIGEKSEFINNNHRCPKCNSKVQIPSDSASASSGLPSWFKELLPWALLLGILTLVFSRIPNVAEEQRFPFAMITTGVIYVIYRRIDKIIWSDKPGQYDKDELRELLVDFLSSDDSSAKDRSFIFLPACIQSDRVTQDELQQEYLKQNPELLNKASTLPGRSDDIND